MNAYAHLLQQMRVLLRTEERMAPDARASFSWVLRADVHDTHCTVVKGGANTIVITLGDQRLEPRYPDDAMGVINTLSKQAWPLYRVQRGTASRRFHALGAALCITPQMGDTVYGISIDGSERITHRAQKNAAGRVSWIARKE